MAKFVHAKYLAILIKERSINTFSGVWGWSVSSRTRAMTDTRVEIGAEAYSKPATLARMALFLWMVWISSLQRKQRFTLKCALFVVVWRIDETLFAFLWTESL